MHSDGTADKAADALFAAWRDLSPLASIGSWLKEGDVGGAYAVQQALHERFVAHGRRQVGWKVGVTSPAALSAMRAAEPMIGIIYADSVLADGGRFDPAQGFAPKLEGELLIELSDRAAGGEVLHEVRDAVASIRPAFEIADSRFVGWAREIAPAIADNACCGWLVPGETGIPAAGFDDSAVTMTMRIDGTTVSQGSGADGIGGAFEILGWFLTQARLRGLPIATGQWLLTGAIGPAIPAPSRGLARVHLVGIGSASLAIGAP